MASSVENPDDRISPGEAEQGIVDVVQFILANSSHKPSDLGSMTLPQVNAIADGIRKWKIHAWGVGLNGDKKSAKKDDNVVEEPTIDDIMAFAARSAGAVG